MTKVILYMATSRDHFIADKQGGVEWLGQGTADQDYGYKAFYDSIDALAMGSKTYEQVIGFGPWAWPGKAAFVFTKRKFAEEVKEVEFVNDRIEDFLRNIHKRGIKQLWLLGGEQLAASFEHCGRIDQYILTIVPQLLGEGILLTSWKESLASGRLYKVASIDCGGGVTQEVYNRSS